MRYIRYTLWPVAVAMTITMTSCSSDDVTMDGQKGKSVSFAISSVNTRTAYDNTDNWVINWVSDDEVLIHSNECPLPEITHEATYKVTGTTNSGTLSPKAENNMLYWDGDKTKDHTFAAAYPASRATWESGDKFTFPVPLAQNGSMDNCYMVARSTGLRSTLEKTTVFLTFKSIMTTLDVTLQSATDDATKRRTITSVEFTTQIPCTAEDKFTYDAVNTSVPTALTTNTIVWTPTSTTVLEGSANSTPNTYTLNVFFPFVEFNSTNKVKIKVNLKDENGEDKEFSATLTPASPIEKGHKAKIKLPSLNVVYPMGISAEHEGFAEEINLDY